MSVKPVCFMVMPFGRKQTQVETGKGPAEIDFNTLWDQAYFPLLQELGYEPVRADQESGSLIINQMLERLYFSDLVLADLTIPNGNVYYEIGVRHAAKSDGCVLLAADWSKQLFDVAQMRTVRYPLPKGEIDAASAQAVRLAIGPKIEAMRRGRSPVYEALPGYPEGVDDATRAGVRDQTQALAAFQAQMRALRAMPPARRLQDARAIIASYGQRPVVPSVAVGLLRLLVSCVEDAAGWGEVLSYIGGLDSEVANEPFVREQRALALGKDGRHQEAIAELLALIEVAGDTSEREGLLGGRHKDLMRAAQEAGKVSEAVYFRNQAIEHYERGMMLDLNDFYPSSNLPRLYRSRGEKGDESHAQTTLQVVSAACQRELKRGTANEWVRPTLLGVAFDLGDPDQAEEIAVQVEREGADAWKLGTTVKDLEASVLQVVDADRKARLLAVLERLKALIDPQPQ
jgi:tetratricopeptide (TPR) repeat protein